MRPRLPNNSAAAVPLPLMGPEAGEPASAAIGRSSLVSEGPGGAQVRRSVLPGGIRVLTESMPDQRSATIGFWIGVGSRDESDGQHGSTHFLEHLLFKGTRRRTALDIASAFDEVGGESNAATAKESTCYYARVLDADLPMAIDVIADMVTGAVLDPAELEQERTVILEEIAMDNDDPAEVAHEKFVESVLAGHALARPIGGTPEAIQGVPRASVHEHYERHYRPAELVVTAAGGLDHGVVCQLVLEAVNRGGWSLSPQGEPAARRSASVANIAGNPGLHVHHRSVEQANIVMGCPSITATDERRYVMSVLNAVLGGGMSSRLFQEVREKRGLAYATYSFSAAYADAGYFGMYAGCSPARTREVIDLMGSELDRLAAEGITDVELAKAVGQLSGGIVLALEDTGSRMSRLGRAELVTGEFVDVDAALERIRQVTGEQVKELAFELAGSERTITVVGPFNSAEDLGF